MNFNYTRDELLCKPSYWKSCNLGAAQQKHNYDEGLLNRILEKASNIYDEVAEKKHLDLRYIRDAKKHIPEIEELTHDFCRLERLNDLAGTRLENYPIGVIASIVTFMSDDTRDGAVAWHADGVPITELIPLEISNDIEGGELEIYQSDYEIGLMHLEQNISIPSENILSLLHRKECSTLAQLMRVLHRTAPIKKGRRVTLNLNLRSIDKPYIDDNHMFYLGADNPDFHWLDDYIKDVKNIQLPAYMKNLKAAV